MKQQHPANVSPNSRNALPPERRSPRQLLLASAAISALSAGIASAQTAPATTGIAPPPPPLPASTPSLNEVIVTGTRQTGTTVRKSLTPITVISGKALQQTGAVSLRDALTRIAPSIEHQAMGYDTAALKDVLTLHGLTPNDVLVLVNGKRRHDTANITLDGGAQQGSTGVDIDMIPVSAIDHIEILRGGDSAQYGSDAIAGVINIILKSADHGGSVSTTLGRDYVGDGFQRDLAANMGTPLGENGFLNLSGEYAGENFTNRMAIDPRTGQRDNKIQGDPQSNRELFGYNAGYFLEDGIEVYSFGTYGHRNGESYENYRVPSVLPEVYPNGFSPIETDDEDDFSETAGVKGGGLLGWDWDLSSTYGGDNDSIGMIKSANVDFYDAFGYTPTTFHLYQLTDTELTNNLDLSRSFPVAILPAPLHVSWGLSQDIQTYQIGGGDFPGQYGSGAAALPGLSALSTGKYFRHSIGAYLDLATKITRPWSVDLAGRAEHYSDVGNTVNGELSTRYAFNPEVAVRGDVGTAFQAPSLAEEYFNNVNVGPISASGLLAADSAAAKSLGALPLKPENSTNYDAGIVLDPLPAFNVTADAYQIDIRNRVVEGGSVSGATAIAALSRAGFIIASGLNPANVSADYFTNGANTQTRGVDISSTYLEDCQDFGSINWSLAANINDTEVTKIAINAQGAPDLNAQQKSYLTSSTPKFKIILGGDWEREKWGFSLDETMYGPVSAEETYTTGLNAYSTTVFGHFVEPIKFTTDIELRYNLLAHLQAAIGANNLFNVYPKPLPAQYSYAGSKYDAGLSQIGIDGGLYYIRARYMF